MNRIYFILIFLGLTIISYSQDNKWMIYPTIGIDMGGALPYPLSYIPEEFNGTPTIKPNIGIGGQYSINDKWNIGLDVSYHILAFTANATVKSQAFWTDDRSSVLYFSGDTHTEVELRFVEFPITTYYKLGDNWSLLFGAYYSLVLEGEFVTEARDGVTSDDKSITDNANLPGIVDRDYDFTDKLDNYDAGFLFGYQYKIVPRLLFWGKFNVGMKSIFVPEFQNLDYDMYQLRLSTGVSFVLFSD